MSICKTCSRHRLCVGSSPAKEPPDNEQLGLLAVIFLACYFPDKHPKLCYFFLPHTEDEWYLWCHRSQMKPWYKVASSSGESIFADEVDHLDKIE